MLEKNGKAKISLENKEALGNLLFLSKNGFEFVSNGQ